MSPNSDPERPEVTPPGDAVTPSDPDHKISAPTVEDSTLQSNLAEVAEEEDFSGDGGRGGKTPPEGEWGGDGGDPPEMGGMSFLDHLEELRKRVFTSLIAILVGFLACWTFADDLYAGLALPLTNILREMNLEDHLVYTNPTAPFNLYVKLAFMAGLFLTSPFIMYQAWKFISPGLYPREKKYAVPFVVFCSFLFISGGVFAYAIAFPAALRFLLNFGSQFRPMITVNEYFGLAMTLILGSALVFELPVLILFLTLLRMMTPKFLIRNFRYATLIIFVAAAAITPSPDIPTMLVFAAPLMVLYFVGVGLSALVIWNRRRKEE